MDNKRQIFTNPGGGFFGGIIRHLKLVWGLLQDERVPFWLKLIPFSTFLYLIFPLDIPGPFDDAAVIWLGSYIFLEMCPQDVVEEVRKGIDETLTVEARDPDEEPEEAQEIVDAEFTHINNKILSEDKE